MNELSIREQKGDFFTIVDLSGELMQETLPSLEAILRSFLEDAKPEFILVDCKNLAGIDCESFETLKKLAIIFSEQARELALCSLSDSLYAQEFFSPQLSYYSSREDAMEVFREALPQESQALFSLQTSILTVTVEDEKKRKSASVRGQQELIIGRHSKCGLSLPHNIQISRFHCKCYQKNNKFYLEDLNSANGTIYQDTFIEEPVEIENGSKFKLGSTWVEVGISHEDTSAETPLPELKIPDVSENEESTSLEFPKFSDADALQTKFSLNLSDLLTEGEETVTMPVDSTRLANLYSEFVLQEPIEGEPKNKFSPFVFPADAMLPTPISRNAEKIIPGQVLAKRYKVQQLLGESNTAFMLLCEDVSNGALLYLQYAKEPMFLHHLVHSHPHLLFPYTQGDVAERWFCVYIEGEAIPSPPIAEAKILEIGLALSDVLLSLHKVGRSGFDLAPCHIIYGKNGVPNFAMIPAVIYNDVLGEKADIFSLGSLLLELALGIRPPYTPLGTLKNELISQKLEQAGVSIPFGQLIIDILNLQEQSLAKIEKRFKNILLQLLAPSTAKEKTISLQLIKVENTVISHHTGGKMERIPCGNALLQQLSSLVSPLSDEKLVEIGQNIYNRFFSSRVATALSQAEAKNLLLVLDEQLTPLPWEVAHDGRQFLANRYCIARDLIGMETEDLSKAPLPSPRVFILADIAPWAQEIKEVLLKAFQQLSNVKVIACDTSEKPLNIVQNMFHCDIFHVIGSVSYQNSEPMDSGWVLSPRKNLFKIRLLKNSPRRPRLIFYQGKMKSIPDTQNFLTSLYKIGLKHTVGTLWSVKKPELPLVFYRRLFQGASIGEAILRTREEFADNLNLALSLFLYGPPHAAVVSK